jgi:hypothetical protein
MNKCIVFAVVLAGGMSDSRIAAAPPLMDLPGPGYRLQRDLFAPDNGKTITHLQLTPSLFLQKTFLSPGPIRADKAFDSVAPLPAGNPFTEPIRLFDIRKD